MSVVRAKWPTFDITLLTHSLSLSYSLGINSVDTVFLSRGWYLWSKECSRHWKPKSLTVWYGCISLAIKKHITLVKVFQHAEFRGYGFFAWKTSSSVSCPPLYGSSTSLLFDNSESSSPCDTRQYDSLPSAATCYLYCRHMNSRVYKTCNKPVAVSFVALNNFPILTGKSKKLSHCNCWVF